MIIFALCNSRTSFKRFPRKVFVGRVKVEVSRLNCMLCFRIFHAVIRSTIERARIGTYYISARIYIQLTFLFLLVK